MTVNLFFKTSMVWVIIALLAIFNGIFRENILVIHLGQSMAVPISGLMLIMIVFTVTYLSSPLFGKQYARIYLFIGVQWVVMTLVFECIFGHYVMDKSWSTLLQVFDIRKGDLMIVVLLVSLVSPLLVARIKNNIL